MNWRKHKSMSVSGCIDSNGAISYKESVGIEAHRVTESRGKRWRWIIHSQEFMSPAPRTIRESNDIHSLELTNDEFEAVKDFLVKKGFASEDSFNVKEVSRE